MIIIKILGDLVPYKAPQVYQRSTVNPRWQEKKQIQAFIQETYNENPLLTCPVLVEYLFGFGMPKHWSKKKKEQALKDEILPDIAPDNSNLIKFYDDCLQDTVILNDKQITDHIIKKRWREKDFVYIKISPMQNSD